MALFLVQHGISAARDIDPEKGLTEQGKSETERIAQVAGSYGIPVERIVHSDKKRAIQTAAIFQEHLSLKASPETISGIHPQDDVRVFARKIHPESNLMVVGHMPFLQRLVSYLTTGSEDIKVYQFQNSGVVCLDADKGSDGKADWFIKWTLNPRIS